MKKEEKLIQLLQIDNIVLARDIQNYLREKGINSIIESDNPASSVMNVYTGMNVIETISVFVKESDLNSALQILKGSPYQDFIENNSNV